MYEYVQPTERA